MVAKSSVVEEDVVVTASSRRPYLCASLDHDLAHRRSQEKISAELDYDRAELGCDVGADLNSAIS